MFCCCYSKTHTPEANTNYNSHKQPLSAEGLRNRLHRRELNRYCQKDTEDGTAMKNQLGSWKTPLLQLGYCNEATEQRALTAVTVWSLGIYSTVTAHLCLSSPVWEGWLQMEITHRFLFLSYLRRRGCWPFPPPNRATCSQMGRKKPCIQQRSTWKNSLSQFLTFASCGCGITHFHSNNCLNHEHITQLQARVNSCYTCCSSTERRQARNVPDETKPSCTDRVWCEHWEKGRKQHSSA